jgi:hypothetical protein
LVYLGARIAAGRRADSRASVKRVIFGQGHGVFDESKYSSSGFSTCARVAIGAAQFTDPIASSTAMKARAVLAAYWVNAIGVARLDEFRN